MSDTHLFGGYSSCVTLVPSLDVWHHCNSALYGCVSSLDVNVYITVWMCAITARCECEPEIVNPASLVQQLLLD